VKYADYVGKGLSLDYYAARRISHKNAEMDFKRSGLYGRFHLPMAYLLDHQHWTVEQLLNNPPSEAGVEAAIREEKP
jgi:hypothetical protein